jgi:transcriptional regulator with XRE-family HTH domain
MAYHDIQYQRFFDWLILQRNLKGLTQLQLSKLLGKNQSFVSKYENCEQHLTFIDFIEICGILDCDPTVEINGLIYAIKNKQSN